MRVFKDEEIYAYCGAHPEEPRCRCLYPEPSVEAIGRDLRLPYYCWYEPCKRADALLPAALCANIARCNVTNCSVTLGEIVLRNGALEVSNACLSSSALPVSFAARYLNQQELPPVLPPGVLLLCFCAAALLVAL